ncbi:MAG TPA: hypothetical protein DCW47_00395 [Lachnospiraceae bacterium]|nr:hypothetical protein [Lachnospiraceae bacterium]
MNRNIRQRIFGYPWGGLCLLMLLLLFAGILTGCKVTTQDDLEKEAATEAAKEPFAGHFRVDGKTAGGQSADGAFTTVASDDVRAYPEDGPITFIEGDFYGKKIDDENDALEAVYSIIEDLGGDEETVLECETIRPTEDGVNYITFRQLEADTAVYGAAVKVIVGADGHISALVSSLVPGIDADNMEEWAITAEEAEQIVLSENKGLGLSVVKDATEQTLLPFLDDSEEFYYVWIVYTNNVYSDYDTAYLAHYVDEEGEYLYALPVTEPGNSDSLSGEGASLAFTGFKAGTYSATVKKHDGSTEDITVPILIDTETGDEYLGDLDRKILVADYAEFAGNDEIDIRAKGKNGFEDNELLIYDTYIRVYDEYEEVGWSGPDGEESPTLLLMDWVDENGDVVNNACYAGRMHGFHVFQFNREDPDGENTDVIAHEFTHCVTGTLMLYNLYYNDYGAINEAFSDICGNLIEAMLGDTEDKTWLVGEHETYGAYRSMSDPHMYNQPAFVWDMYYAPHPETITENNDYGGVHTNSSLLNLIAYRLNESGMDYADQLYYWMNVALALTPRTDYVDIAHLLRWCMKEMGYKDYETVLKDAIEETKIEVNTIPDKAPDGLGLVKFDFPFAVPENPHGVTVLFTDLDTFFEYTSWPEDTESVVAASMPEGDYAVVIFLDNDDSSMFMDLLLTEDGFIEVRDEVELYNIINEIDPVNYCHVRKGEITELDSETLVPLLEKAEEKLWMNSAYDE